MRYSVYIWIPKVNKLYVNKEDVWLASLVLKPHPPKHAAMHPCSLQCLPNVLMPYLLLWQFCTNEASDCHILMVITRIPAEIGGGGKKWIIF